MSEFFSWQSLLVLILGYVLGSIPFGLLLTKMGGLGDIRNVGSGNIGATNVLRTGKKSLALATLLLDGGKAYVAVVLGMTLSPTLGALAGLGAFLGHLYPVWLKFKGGKGVATFLGALLGLSGGLGFMALGIWVTSAVLFGYSSLSALIAAAIMPIAFYILLDGTIAILVFAMTVLIFIRHHENISRLLSGTESKIGASK